jgi:hypothetical protein
MVQRIGDAAGEDLLFCFFVSYAEVWVAAKRIAECDQFPMLGAVALDDMRVDPEAVAEGGNSGYSHRPCLRKWLAAGLSLEAERVEGGPGEFEISCQVCDGEIDDTFSATARHGSAADVFNNNPGRALIEGLF